MFSWEGCDSEKVCLMLWFREKDGVGSDVEWYVCERERLAGQRTPGNERSIYTQDVISIFVICDSTVGHRSPSGVSLGGLSPILPSIQTTHCYFRPGQKEGGRRSSVIYTPKPQQQIAP